MCAYRDLEAKTSVGRGVVWVHTAEYYFMLCDLSCSRAQRSEPGNLVMRASVILLTYLLPIYVDWTDLTVPIWDGAVRPSG